jgi:hypothetical protein
MTICTAPNKGQRLAKVSEDRKSELMLLGNTDQDFLGYASYVSVLADTCTMKDLAPLTLGIFGAWGSGKTSLMRMLQAKVDSTPEVRVPASTLWCVGLLEFTIQGRTKPH